MGSASGYICRTCGAKFQVRSGGFFFDLLHCDTGSRCHCSLVDLHVGQRA
jgi:DNA-directed RNA polymerase subunit RPC12/RpoP